MGIGNHVDLNRRYGGHVAGGTEWEISTRTADFFDRVRTLEQLGLEALVCFHYQQE